MLVGWPHKPRSSMVAVAGRKEHRLPHDGGRLRPFVLLAQVWRSRSFLVQGGGGWCCKRVRLGRHIIFVVCKS